MTRALRFTVVIAVITAVLFVWSMAWAQTKTVQSKTATVTTSKILVTKHPKVVKLKQPVSSKYIVAPRPLTRVEKQVYTREMLQALRGKNVKLPQLPAQVANVRLMPDAPRSGFNWYEICGGSNYPFPRNDRPAYTYIGYGSINLHLERTIPGKLYMLDLAVGSTRPDKTRYIFSGAVEGEIKPQRGHLVAGFVASRGISEITLKLKKVSRKRNTLIYSIEVTQVN